MYFGVNGKATIGLLYNVSLISYSAEVIRPKALKIDVFDYPSIV